MKETELENSILAEVTTTKDFMNGLVEGKLCNNGLAYMFVTTNLGI